MRRIPISAVLFLFTAFASLLQPAAAEDLSKYTDDYYRGLFHDHFTAGDPVPALGEMVSVERYDALYMGDSLDRNLEILKSDTGGLAWGMSYWFMSINEMFRVTGEPRYLEQQLENMKVLLSVRDDSRLLELWDGRTSTAWSAQRYTKRGGPAVHAVHTGVITYPMLEFVVLAREAGEKFAGHEAELAAILKSATEALAWHDYQWVEGPAPDEGHYIGRDQEESLEGEVLPLNRLSAMGRALWWAWRATGEEAYRDKALRIGRFMKRRITPVPSGAYHWNYSVYLHSEKTAGPEDYIPGEDMSHGSLSMALACTLGAAGEVFDTTDMHRFCKTLEGLGRLGKGILLANVTGVPTNHPNQVQLPARWLRVTPWCPDNYRIIGDFYRYYRPTPSPLGMALLLRYRPVE